MDLSNYIPFPNIRQSINIPDDLSQVTVYDPSEEVDPAEAGLTQHDINTIWEGVENYYKTGIHPSIALCLRRQGKIVIKRTIGHAKGNIQGDTTAPVVMHPETPICQFSASKAVTAMIIHHLAENGQLHLTDPVCHYIPEFGAHGKEAVTVYHVLSHRSGFGIIPDNISTDVLFDHDEAVKMICDMAPQYPAGHTASYHAITGGYILHEILRRVTGKDIREYLKETIQEPLGFKYFNYGIDENKIETVAKSYFTGWPVVYPFTMIVRRSLGGPWDMAVKMANDNRFFTSIIPSANLIATVDEMCQFFQLLLNGGELNGVRIFDPVTVRRAIIEAGKMQLDKSMVLLPMRYSAGMMLGSDPFGMFGPNTQNAYGHWGFINSFSWADPDRDIAVSMLNTGKPFLSTHLVSHFDLLTRIARHCKKD
ncbi:MAG: Beta-lactamase domain-containing protein [Candidatus Magnetoglobus multicellularis str. Araruama]|uniref:Beta-lactamase domain-containing protein n=1 Tax=Candidatus Magnetoglobus multicellularis str. Araruama TaxID=890399 RepID=A0A1V1PF24_9BACT|nr:MAG: Beta-lactamase domain-containing protein [Candidatus Magnetoglobus multicellularis str. Araruama]